MRWIKLNEIVRFAGSHDKTNIRKKVRLENFSNEKKLKDLSGKRFKQKNNISLKILASKIGKS